MEELGFLIDALASPRDMARHELDEGELSRIVALWDGMRFEEAGAQASQLYREGVHDIRLLVYSLHTYFVEAGPSHVEPVLATLEQLLREYPSQLGPERLRTAHFDKRLSWLFRTMADNLRCQGTAQDLGRPWQRAMPEPTIEQLRKKVDALHELLEPLGLVEAPTALAMLWVEVDRLPRDASKVLAAPPAALPPAAAALPDAPPTPAKGPTDISELAPEQLVVSLKVSGEFLGLCAKLSCFRRLVARRDFKRAAVVADDLNAVIAGFDPVQYFPALFLEYTQQLAASLEQLAPCLQERDGMEWAVLKQLYRAAPREFAEP